MWAMSMCIKKGLKKCSKIMTFRICSVRCCEVIRLNLIHWPYIWWVCVRAYGRVCFYVAPAVGANLYLMLLHWKIIIFIVKVKTGTRIIISFLSYIQYLFISFILYNTTIKEIKCCYLGLFPVAGKTICIKVN